MGENAFKGNKKLISVSIPNSVTDIGSSAFSLCTGLKTITLSNSLINIGDNAFSGCRYLTSITIPSTVVSMGERSFANCTSLSSIVIPKPVTSIRNYAFGECTGLSSIIIPNSVVNIGDGAFKNCKGIDNIFVPNSVAKIGNGAFEGVSCISYDGALRGTPWGAQRMGIVDKSKIKTIEDYLYYNNIKATTTFSGAYIIVNKKGQSRNTVSSGCEVTADYIMRQLDGTIIDCSDENLANQSLTYNSTRYYEPLRYTVGRTAMIKGWEEGIMGQTEGSVITLIVPSNLAYGEKGLEPHIAPNTPLIIEITIRQVNCPRQRK